jgi:phage terminase large subunit-like protein
MFPIANEVAGLQGLDPSLAIVDELAFMPIESWVALTESTGKRDRSLIVGISTPGVDRNNALWQIRAQVLAGQDMPGFRYSEFAADDGCAKDDEAQWRKANPAIAAGFLRIEALRSSVKRTPEAMFRIFRLGQWIDGVEGWLGADGQSVWARGADPWEFEAGAATWAAIDVGIKRDSAAVQRRPDGRLHVKERIWVPTAAEPVDVRESMGYLRELHSKYRLVRVSYDPRFFDVPAKMLEDEGLPMVEVPQSVEAMTPAVGATYEAIVRGDVTHDGDLATTAQVLNAVPRYNDRGFTLEKRKSRGRIDGAVAMCLAVACAVQPETAPLQAVIW